MDEINTLITQVAFPIVMCLLLYKYMMDLNEQHKEETNELKSAINNLNITVQKLIDKLDKGVE